MLKDSQILSGKIEMIITNHDTGSLSSSQFKSNRFNSIQEARDFQGLLDVKNNKKPPKTLAYVKEIKDEEWAREMGVGDKTLQNLLVRRII